MTQSNCSMEGDALLHSRPDAAQAETQRVPIIIVTYRNSDDAIACLKSLAVSTQKEFEVHICENGGPDAYRELTGAFPTLEPISTSPIAAIVSSTRATLPGGQSVLLHRARENLGYAGGINAALAWLAGDPNWRAVWILNPDTKVHPDALKAALSRLENGGFGMVGSRLILEERNRIHLYAGRWRPLMARGLNLGLGAPSDMSPDIAEIERRMNYVCGAAMLVTRSFIEDVGPMDDRYFLYCEEVDWCLRRQHHRLGYAHDSIVYHGHGTTTGATGRHGQRSELSVYLGERNKLLLTKRFYRPIYPLVIVSTLLLTGQYLAQRSVRNFRTALAGWAAGLRGEEGIPPRFKRSHGASA